MLPKALERLHMAATCRWGYLAKEVQKLAMGVPGCQLQSHAEWSAGCLQGSSLSYLFVHPQERAFCMWKHRKYYTH